MPETLFLNACYQTINTWKFIKPSEVWSEAEQVRKREVGSGRRRKSTFHGFHYRWWLLELGLMRQFRASAWPGSGRFLIVQGDALNSARHGRPL